MDTQTAARANGRPRRFSLRHKLNLVIVNAVLFSSLSVFFLAFFVHCRQIDRICFDEAERAALNVSKYFNSSVDDNAVIENFWKEISTEEFRSLRERAVREDDPALIEAWMKSTRSAKGSADPERSLMDDYFYCCDRLLSIEESFPLSNLYIQRDEGELTYNLIDPEESFLNIGSTEILIDIFQEYDNNSRIPATVYRSEYGWLCTACEPVYLFSTGEPFALISADIDMNDIVRERALFLFNCLLLILLATVAAIIINLFFIRRIATKPLCRLREAVCRFTAGEKAYTAENMVKLDYRANDEISDLYQEIRSMQERIMDYTHDLEQVTAERERIRTELDLAGRIQRNALPELGADFTGHSGFTLAASMTPAREVGGDFYDFFFTDENHLALVIADVSGKGIPAALFMMSAKNTLGSRALIGGTPAEILTDVNLRLCQHNPTNMFVTVWLGILDLRTGLLTACNAGHEEPALRGADGVFRLCHDKHGFVLGGMKRSRYTDYELQLAPGDTVFVYTDGVTEASDEKLLFYETDRLLAALNAPGPANPNELLTAVQQSIQDFVGQAEQADDLTMLCIQYRGTETKDNTNT